MNDLSVDVSFGSLIKHGEELCGDMVQLIRDKNTTVLVLADGLGSGVKANILATLTSKIISTMIAEKMSIEDCVSTVISTLPVCQTRGVAYSTFTIIIVKDNENAKIIQYDNPSVILLRDGKNYDYPVNTKIIAGKKICESDVLLKENDLFIAMSDGAIYAGVGRVMNYGWQRENIVEFAESKFNKNLSSQGMTSLILSACDDLYEKKPGDDTTIATIKVRKRSVVNLLFGPPQNPDELNEMLSLFFAKSGKHIVSGGTTSSLTAEFLGKELNTSIDYLDPDIPPTASISGVDLVTEGVITLSRVLEYAKDALDQKKYYETWSRKKDGASQISKMLFEEATDINFYVGKAINPAHQNPELPITFNIKMQLASELISNLEKMGKTVTASYF